MTTTDRLRTARGYLARALGVLDAPHDDADELAIPRRYARAAIDYYAQDSAFVARIQAQQTDTTG